MNMRSILIGAVVAIAVMFSLGVIIGWFSHKPKKSECDGPCLGPDVPDKIIEDADDGITQKILDAINGTNIREYLKSYTSYPHLAGTDGDNRLADELFQEWTRQGLDDVDQIEYTILLSYPNKTDPNLVYLLNSTSDIIYTSQEVEAILSKDQNHTDVVPPFNAYSPPGNVTGDLVYVNYGRIEDFKELTNNYSVNVTGKIVIARYGKIFRGDKVANAALFGAVGVILYSDPADYSLDDNEPVFPNSWWLPGTGVQRGTIKQTSRPGDPLTPGYPATETAYRLKDSPDLPKIPCHPIGYDDATHFMRELAGNDVPDHWKGRLQNVTYRFGPGFNSSGIASNGSVRLYVSTTNATVKTSNVFAYIRGSVEPDRYVLLGNHRDAWVFGGVDPTSGTALMMEVSRVLGNLVKQGWRPRRTIVFCSWGAEEYGLIGSYEWVEEFIKNLGNRAVAYLNVDLSVEGHASMRVKGVPLLYDLLYDVAKKIPSANDASVTVFDEWVKTFPSSTDSELPTIQPMGAASDFASFIGIAGVPCIDFRYTHDFTIIDYPLYHSVYETFDLFDRFYEENDHSYKYQVSVGRFWGEAARYLADSLILPLSAVQYADSLATFVKTLRSTHGALMEGQNITLDGLDTAVSRFQKVATSFHDTIASANRKNPLEIRMINDQLMQLERAFIDSQGLPDREYQKHVLFAPSAFNSYDGSTFPGLIDLMWDIEESADPDTQWDRVREHLAAVIYCVNSATSIIQPVTQFSQR